MHVTFNDVPQTLATILARIDGLEQQMAKLIAILEARDAVAQDPVTQKELCGHLGVTPQTLIRWKKRKKIPFIKVGRTVRYNLGDVLAALEKKTK
jgi:excisionase family DNA binding protein